MEMPATSPRAPGQATSARIRRRDALEIILIYGLILTMEWMPLRWHRELWIIAAAGVALSLIHI